VLLPQIDFWGFFAHFLLDLLVECIENRSMQINQFRVWNKKECRFLSDGEFLLNSRGEIYLREGGIATKSTNNVTCFYTGINDKDGAPIYSHDLISFTVKGAIHGREVENYAAQEVYFDSECAAFMIGKNYSKSGDFWWGHSFMDELDMDTVKVVGNIFTK
jgi:hypothetical protein